MAGWGDFFHTLPLPYIGLRGLGGELPTLIPPSLRIVREPLGWPVLQPMKWLCLRGEVSLATDAKVGQLACA